MSKTRNKMNGYDLIFRTLLVHEGKLKEFRIFKKQPLWWRLRWVIIVILFSLIIADKLIQK